MIRSERVAAVARLDLRTELKGRQGFLLPAILAGLLLPVAALPDLGELVAPREQRQHITVYGDVPHAVLALPGVSVRPEGGGQVRFEYRDGILYVEGPIRPDVRAVLDGPDSPVTRVSVPRVISLPQRTMLLGLLSASVLTGAVSASIGGERSRRTLVILLSAAVARAEIVGGKFAAWGGLGALATLVAAATAIAAGHAPFGWWLVPLPCVPLVTVALGLWLVRNATDVVGGTTTTLRVLPVVLALGAIVAWVLGSVHPLLGAAVPVGGAVVAAGQTWPGAWPPLVAAASTLALIAACLWGTVRDLEEAPDRDPLERTLFLAAGLGSLAALLWWIPVAVPLLWGVAGNQRLSDDLPPENGILAGALGLLAICVVRAARATGPRDALLLARPSLDGIASGLAIGVVLAALQLVPFPPLTDGPLMASFSERLGAAFHPTWAGFAGWLVVVADELFFRGVLLRSLGPLGSILGYVIVRAPLDPLRGLLVGTLLTGTAHRTRSVWPALVAHAVWFALPM